MLWVHDTYMHAYTKNSEAIFSLCERRENKSQIIKVFSKTNRKENWLSFLFHFNPELLSPKFP